MADTTTATGDEQSVPVAAGTDLDSRKRAAKHTLAAANATGDREAADAAQKELDAVNDELSNLDRGTSREQSKEEAAKQRRANASANGRTTPQGRTAAPKDTTDAPATGKTNK